MVTALLVTAANMLHHRGVQSPLVGPSATPEDQFSASVLQTGNMEGSKRQLASLQYSKSYSGHCGAVVGPH